MEKKYAAYKTYQKYKKQGLCVRCGGIPVRGEILCSSCKRKNRRRINRKKYIPARRTRISRHICLHCRKPVNNDQWKLCNACHDKMVALSKKALEKRKEKTLRGQVKK